MRKQDDNGKSASGGSGGASPTTSTGSDTDAGVEEPQGRAQDARKFTIDPQSVAFDALPNTTAETDRYSGVLDGAGYRIEVPKDWNGTLVMYAHGYAGTGEALRVTTPSIRRYLIEQGYAWAASSYSANYYDVRVGVEDTNQLALEFNNLTKAKGRELEAPKRRYIIGHSMGGHITGAAIESEAQQTANHKVKYDGAVPMCGVMGDVALFSYFAAYQAAAQQLTGKIVPAPTAPDFAAVVMDMKTALFSTWPSQTTDKGEQLKMIVANLTGGMRPAFALGFGAEQWQNAVWNTFGGDGKVSGILTLPVTDTREIVFQLDSDPAQSDAEMAFNAAVQRVQPAADANALRADGLRYIPAVNGEFAIPVVSMHTLGDLYVPFKMQQIYHDRAEAKGSAQWLVQRAIRGTGHCEFTYAEQVAAFEAMVNWEQNGVKPEGDEVIDPAIVGADDYGCRFTDNNFSAEETTAAMLPAARAALPACPQ